MNSGAGVYLRLFRFHSMTGAWLLMWPCLWSVAMLMQELKDLLWVPFFVFGSLLMRSFGCAINDLVDIKVDQKVARTTVRPLASGELQPAQVLRILLLLLPIAFSMAAFLGDKGVILSIVLFCLIVLYPFSKRFFHYPQFLLALIFSAGSLYGGIAINGRLDLAPIMLYFGSAAWVVYYDTVYAHQDKHDDKSLGLKSTALSRFGSKHSLTYFSRFALFCWAIAGALANEGLLFFLSILLVFFKFRRQIKKVDLDAPESCMSVFKDNNQVGWIMFLGALIGRISY